MKRITGLAAVQKGLAREIERITYLAAEGAMKVARDILEGAKFRCPRVTSNLANSGFLVWRTPRAVRSRYSGRFKNPSNKKNSSIAQDLSAERLAAIEEATTRVAGSKTYMTEIHFSAPYAVAVHENPRAGSTKGISPSGKKYPEGTYATEGEWKFLETEMKLKAMGALQMIATNIKGKNML